MRTGPMDDAIAEVRPDQAGARKNGPQAVRKSRGGWTAGGCRACPNGGGISAGHVMRPRDAGGPIVREIGRGNRTCRRTGHMKATGAVNLRRGWDRCFLHSGSGLSLGMRPGDVQAVQRSRVIVPAADGIAPHPPRFGQFDAVFPGFIVSVPVFNALR